MVAERDTLTDQLGELPADGDPNAVAISIAKVRRLVWRALASYVLLALQGSSSNGAAVRVFAFSLRREPGQQGSGRGRVRTHRSRHVRVHVLALRSQVRDLEARLLAEREEKASLLEEKQALQARLMKLREAGTVRARPPTHTLSAPPSPSACPRPAMTSGPPAAALAGGGGGKRWW